MPHSSFRVIDQQGLVYGGPVLEDEERGEAQEDEIGCAQVQKTRAEHKKTTWLDDVMECFFCDAHNVSPVKS